ncbi:MAG: succinate dehydrogenase assembly factor 2 [Gammaproteobacteria bacterium]|nr:succinate dehydrogenase assembly factor 2 [Gammaproteobacteria bacterium]
METRNDAARADCERVRWRSRRGMLELDLLLVGFADKCYPTLSRPLQADYRALLECDDWIVLDWLRERESPPQEFGVVVEAIREFNRGEP